ncbi:MAG TPA: sigma-54 dependent transcriptional regulator [Vitreimonas sp.]|uniref:sigma-54-dependent transcriptional regulator FlbD n=1 Tax=Vitreimonas sp. TaxID=3069702 RepID=UPI002D419985|nr:sigma-54 dependent transcriptional regulator [Vitreimonas sp.]HYD87766.1 sigma-54 dependent transcriptional regulator [Vitreimonas sp.]
MRLLIVGPLGGQISAATKIAMENGAKVSHVDTIEQATTALRVRGADLLMVDARLDIEALILANESERIVVPVVAAGVGVDPMMAARAIRQGAREYISLPPDPELIAAVLAAVCDDERPMIAADAAMKQVIALADQVAGSDASIMITGESGVGKEVLARYVHKKSKRRDKPFIAVNCAAIPEHLLESELFGHEKGAFTGAVARRIGKFEEADGGTLLLDEISEMDLRLQSKLLRALQERVIDRVGGAKPVPVNIRILATSNRDLSQSVRAGEFREDLLYRLNVVNLRIPALRERKDDLAALSAFFIDKYARANGRPARRLSAKGLEQVLAHNWPGNVRELENAMHRAILLTNTEEVGAEAIRAPDGAPVGKRDATGDAIEAAQAAARNLVGRTVAEVEQDLILETLTHCLGNRTHAAHILGISIRTLRNKLKQYGDEGVRIPPPPTGQAA